MEVVLLALVSLAGYALVRAITRKSYANWRQSRRQTVQFMQDAMQKDEMRVPSWAHNDHELLRTLAAEVKDALNAGGVSKEKAARMADNQYVIAAALLYAAGFESSGMGKFSQISATATEMQMKAKVFERHYDRNN